MYKMFLWFYSAAHQNTNILLEWEPEMCLVKQDKHVWLKTWCTQQYHFPHIIIIKIYHGCFTSFHKEGRSRTKEGVRMTQTSDTTRSPPPFFNHCKYDFSVVRPWWIINYSKLIFIVCGKHLRLHKLTRRCWRVSFITQGNMRGPKLWILLTISFFFLNEDRSECSWFKCPQQRSTAIQVHLPLLKLLGRFQE